MLPQLLNTGKSYRFCCQAGPAESYEGYDVSYMELRRFAVLPPGSNSLGDTSISVWSLHGLPISAWVCMGPYQKLVLLFWLNCFTFDKRRLVWILSRQLMEVVLPTDAHHLATDRLHVSITNLKSGKNHLVSRFTTRDELIMVHAPTQGRYLYLNFIILAHTCSIISYPLLSTYAILLLNGASFVSSPGPVS